MHISQNVGALPFLGWVFDHGWAFAALMEFIADFAIIWTLMDLESFGKNSTAPTAWARGKYWTFATFGTIVLPPYFAAAVIMLQDAPKLDGFYTQPWFHWLLLAVCVLFSLNLEREALKNGQYTWSQERSPSKLYHTIIFGVVAYWVFSVAIPLIVVHKASWTWALVAWTAIGFVIFTLHDSKKENQPPDAHMEGSWLRWDWRRRYSKS